jgi:hypothetical protein
MSLIGFCRARLRRLRAALLIGLALLIAATPHAVAGPTPSAEYQLKAAFLYKLSQFVEWPDRAFVEPTAPLIIGVLGDDPFGAYLDDLVREEKIGLRPLTVRRYKSTEDAIGCHILFVCRSESGGLEKIIAQLKGRTLLTVSDAETFLRLGGMVRFATENGKIRLKINVEAAKAAELTVSSKILSPATIATAGELSKP